MARKSHLVTPLPKADPTYGVLRDLGMECDEIYNGVEVVDWKARMDFEPRAACLYLFVPTSAGIALISKVRQQIWAVPFARLRKFRVKRRGLQGFIEFDGLTPGGRWLPGKYSTHHKAAKQLVKKLQELQGRAEVLTAPRTADPAAVMEPDITDLGKTLADRDEQAYWAAKEAVQDWLARYPEIAQAAGESDEGATSASRLLVEAHAAASATRAARAAGASVEAIFNEQHFVSTEHAAAGYTKEWVVAFLQIRCISVGYMLGALADKEGAAEMGQRFGEFMRGAADPE